MKPRIFITGQTGKMGKIVEKTLTNSGMRICGGAQNTQEMKTKVQQLKPDVVIDVSNASVVWDHVCWLIDHKQSCVIGTSGLTAEQVETLRSHPHLSQTVCRIVPNFSLGATLMDQCADLIAPWFRHASIVETHHTQKKDAPSGTAQHTQQLLMQHRSLSENGCPAIHSIRSPGVLAKQTISFGNPGETLLIEHQSIDRDCFSYGIHLATSSALSCDPGLMVGLWDILKKPPTPYCERA